MAEVIEGQTYSLSDCTDGSAERCPYCGGVEHNQPSVRNGEVLKALVRSKRYIIPNPHGIPPTHAKGLVVIEYLPDAAMEGWEHRMPGGHPEEILGMYPPARGGFVTPLKPERLCALVAA